MKSFLVLAVLMLAGGVHPSCQPNDRGSVQQLSASARLSARPPGNMMDHAVVIGQRPTGDHAVVIGQRPTGDAGTGATEHLAPLIFMVIAFALTMIAAALIWERKFLKTPKAMTILALVGVLISGLLLAGVNAYIADQHHGGLSDVFHGHHGTEIWLSLIALIALLVTFINEKGAKVGGSIFAAACEIVVIGILLNLLPDYVYKMCDGQCVMRGSQAGVNYDLPCGDNIAFMALHYPTNIDPQTYYNTFIADEELPHYFDYSTAFAMHDPLYPRVIRNGPVCRSEDITFSLEERLVNPVATCSLFVEHRVRSKAELEAANDSFPPIGETQQTLTAIWERQGTTLTKVFPAPAKVVDKIDHTMTVPGTSDKVTYVVYKFKFTYTNPAGQVPTPPDDAEVSFVLQDYYSAFPEHPVPVYVQADMRDVTDLLFIPAQSDAVNDPLPAAFFPEFRSSCRSIIKDAIFQEPSLRFWRKHFNFWINPMAGRALDARCGDCCHVPPDNMALIPEEIEFRALLHHDLQWDFTDHCNTLFSAEMNLINDHDEKSSFLHELGHAAFGLSDEYPGGYNYQAVEHLPNNWDRRKDARKQAHLRHKSERDVVRLY